MDKNVKPETNHRAPQASSTSFGGQPKTNATSRVMTGPQLLTLMVLSLGLAIVIIDTTIVNVTIPSIRKEFNAALADVEWISAVYALVFAAFIVTWGKLGDLFGRKRIFIAGVVTFVAGSILVGNGQSISMIIAGRVIQGFGGAMTSPSTLSIISSTFQGRARGVAFGIWGSVAGAAAALGPLLGGYLTTAATWRWAFLINIPIGVAAIAGALAVIKESKDPGRNVRVDVAGIGLIGVGLAGIVFALIEGSNYGWLTARKDFILGSLTWPAGGVSITLLAGVIGCVFMTTFVLYEITMQRRGSDPLFDFTLLRFRGFRYGLLTVAIIALGEFGIIFVMSLFLQGVRGLSAFDTGLLFLPFALTTFFISPLAGALSSRIGPKWIITTGMLMEAVAIFWVGRAIGVDSPLLALQPALILYGAGVGLSISQLTNLVLSDVPRQRTGAASGANNTVRQIGAAMGIAILGAILSSGISATGRSQTQAIRAEVSANTQLPAIAKSGIEQGLNAIETGLDKGFSEDTSGDAPQGLPAAFASTDIGREISTIFPKAIVEGARNASLAASVFVLLGALSSLLIPNPPKKKEWDPADQPSEAAEAVVVGH